MLLNHSVLEDQSLNKETISVIINNLYFDIFKSFSLIELLNKVQAVVYGTKCNNKVLNFNNLYNYFK